MFEEVKKRLSKENLDRLSLEKLEVYARILKIINDTESSDEIKTEILKLTSDNSLYEQKGGRYYEL